MTSVPADRPRAGAAVAALAGGVIVVAGALLPWLTMFGGVHEVVGISGLNGRLVLVAGAAMTVLGVVLIRRNDARVRLVVALIATATGTFACWLVAQLSGLVGDAAAHPMLLVRPGPGLFVVVIGAVVALGGLGVTGIAPKARASGPDAAVGR